jgi:hypothetical protein
MYKRLKRSLPAMSKNDSGYVMRALPQKFLNIGFALLGIGLISGIIAYMIDPLRASYSYLTSFMFLISLGVGSLFLVSLEYLAGAVWSTPFRRISEFFAGTIPYLIIISIPLLFTLHNVFEWTHSAAVENDAILKGKEAYLNIPFFLVRNVVIFLIWTLFYFLIIKRSRMQDETGDQSLTRANIKLSTGFIFIFAITITISGVDWMMSLEPHWYSTIFGVYYFSGTVWCALAALTLAVVLLKESGYLVPGLKEDHYYSLGTLMFAFTAFWGYIAFSQYMLIWYADLPEETSWFFHRWEGGWMYASIVLIIVHFIVPFFALLSFPAKTNPKRLKFVAVWILAAHFFDLYWVIMPGMHQVGRAYYFSWMDIVFPIAMVGFVMIIFRMLTNKYNLVPVKDPKLKRGLDYSL